MMEENERCPHADLIYQYGIDAKYRTPKPWLFYYWSNPMVSIIKWYQCQEHPVWLRNLNYKRVEPSINIQPIKLPKPIEEAPMRGTKLYVFTPESDKGWDTIVWVDTYEQNVLLKNRALHLYKDYCLQWVNWWQQHIIKGE
jgi:hypothetical protein